MHVLVNTDAIQSQNFLDIRRKINRFYFLVTSQQTVRNVILFSAELFNWFPVDYSYSLTTAKIVMSA